MVVVLTKYYSNCFVIIMDELLKALIQDVVVNSVKCQREELFLWANIVLSRLHMENHLY